MRPVHLICAIVTLAASAPPARASAQPAPVAAAAGATYSVFIGSRLVGREQVEVARDGEEWVIRGSSRVGPPIDIETRNAEIRYDGNWRPRTMTLEGRVRGTETSIRTTFADGQASNTITTAGESTTKNDPVPADALVLPNAFLGSYAALARRLPALAAGSELQIYIAPQGVVPMTVESASRERIETPNRAINATRYAVSLRSGGPSVQASLWADGEGKLLRLSVPAQSLELAREDIASASSRTTSFTIEGEEPVRIPAPGFTLAGGLAKPAGSTAPLPAVILVSGSLSADRDGTVAGIPLTGQLARGLVDAGFLVVRYDKRGVGQSGGRTETATLTDYAEDIRAIFRWLADRDDVDEDRIAVVGHAEGGWLALQAASRERRIAAVGLLASAGISGSELVLEQQRHVLEQLKATDAEAKIALQRRINAAATGGGDWNDIDPQVRAAADTPWFSSFLGFDPARVMRDVRQPLFILQGALDTEVRPYHADRLVELAQARKRQVPADASVVPGVNHLLVPAKTGEIDEYASLSGATLSPAVTAALAEWLTRQLSSSTR